MLRRANVESRKDDCLDGRRASERATKGGRAATVAAAAEAARAETAGAVEKIQEKLLLRYSRPARPRASSSSSSSSERRGAQDRLYFDIYGYIVKET